MGASKLSRGMPLPTFRQCLIVGAALCAGWLFLKEVRQQVDVSEKQLDISEKRDNLSEIDEAANDPVASLHAVEVFVRRGRDAVPRLVVELPAADPRARALAVLGLGKIGPAAAEALDQIRERLTDDSPQVRAHAIFALRSVGENADEAGRVAARMLADPDGEVRDMAARQLLVIGPGVTTIVLEALESDLVAVRSQALRVLREWKQGRQAGWPEWLEEVREPVRRLLNDPDSGIRIDALTTLVAWGIAEPAEIRELLRQEDDARVEVALDAVSRLGESAADLFPDVVALVDRFQLDRVPVYGDNLSPRRMDLILGALIAMKTAARPAAPRLIRLLKARHDLIIRSDIAQTLVAIGMSAEDTEDLVRVLAPLLVDENRGVAYRAGRLLVDVSPEAARRQVSRLLPQLGSGTSVNKAVLYALHALGREAREAGPQVAPLVKNADPWVSDIAKLVLFAVGPDAASKMNAGR